MAGAEGKIDSLNFLERSMLVLQLLDRVDRGLVSIEERICRFPIFEPSLYEFAYCALLAGVLHPYYVFGRLSDSDVQGTLISAAWRLVDRHYKTDVDPNLSEGPPYEIERQTEQLAFLVFVQLSSVYDRYTDKERPDAIYESSELSRCLTKALPDTYDRAIGLPFEIDQYKIDFEKYFSIVALYATTHFMDSLLEIFPKDSQASE